jgi:hypothetical protein
MKTELRWFIREEWDNDVGALVKVKVLQSRTREEDKVYHDPIYKRYPGSVSKWEDVPTEEE